MSPPTAPTHGGAPVFDADPEITYTINVVATLTGVSSQTILHYQEHEFIAPVARGESGEARFDDNALRTLRRLEHLRTTCDMNLAGLKLLHSLMLEVERLRAQVREGR